MRVPPAFQVVSQPCQWACTLHHHWVPGCVCIGLLKRERESPERVYGKAVGKWGSAGPHISMALWGSGTRWWMWNEGDTQRTVWVYVCVSKTARQSRLGQLPGYVCPAQTLAAGITPGQPEVKGSGYMQMTHGRKEMEMVKEGWRLDGQREWRGVKLPVFRGQQFDGWRRGPEYRT